MLGADVLLKFYLEDPNCTYETFIQWYQVRKLSHFDKQFYFLANYIYCIKNTY